MEWGAQVGWKVGAEGDHGGGRTVESAERAVINVERAVESVRRALRERGGVFAFGRTGEGVAREGVKANGKRTARGSDEAGEVGGTGRGCEEERPVDGKGKDREVGKPAAEGNQENGVEDKPEREGQRAEPEVKKPTYAMVLRKGEGSNANLQRQL